MLRFSWTDPHGKIICAASMVSHIWWRLTVDLLWSLQGRGLETFCSGRYCDFFVDVCLVFGARSDRVLTDEALYWLAKAETVANFASLLTLRLSASKEVRNGKRWHLGGEGGLLSGKQCLVRMLAELVKSNSYQLFGARFKGQRMFWKKSKDGKNNSSVPGGR